jgi:hypothetical protein
MMTVRKGNRQAYDVQPGKCHQHVADHSEAIIIKVSTDDPLLP